MLIWRQKATEANLKFNSVLLIKNESILVAIKTFLYYSTIQTQNKLDQFVQQSKFDFYGNFPDQF
jgi:hypothetical protein